MFQRFNWMMFDPTLFYEDPSSRLSIAKQLGTSWSAWTSVARQHKERFDHGDESAIFEFARESKGAFLAPWVIKALRKWQAEGTAPAKRKVFKVVTAWLDSRGRARPEQLFRTIRKDMQIACAVLRLRTKGKTVETAVADVADTRQMREETVREIHKEYSKVSNRLKRSKVEFLAYLQKADPAKVWDAVMERIDDEQTALYLYLEVQSAIRAGQVHFDDLYPGWPPPGNFFDSLVQETPNGQKITISLFRRQIDEGPAAHPAVAGGQYLRLDIHRGTGPTGPQSDETIFWEKLGDEFLRIRPARMPWYEALKNAIR